jgi:hypothetical protein
MLCARLHNLSWLLRMVLNHTFIALCDLRQLTPRISIELHPTQATMGIASTLCIQVDEFHGAGLRIGPNWLHQAILGIRMTLVFSL